MKQAWENLSFTTKAVILVIAVIVVIVIYRRLSKWIDLKGKQKILDKSTETTIVDNQPVTVNLGSVAQQIHDAFHDYYWGMAEDEETAIVAISNVPKSLIPQLSEVYFNLYELNLNGDFVKYLEPEDYNRVANLFN